MVCRQRYGNPFGGARPKSASSVNSILPGALQETDYTLNTPVFVEKKSIMDEELIPHFSGPGYPKLRLSPSSAEGGKSSEIWYQTPPETFQHQTLAILFFD